MRRVAEEPSPSTSCAAPNGDDARKRFRFQSLFQDYMELIKETEEKKRRLVETRQKKRRLLSEVRFLRRKYEILSANQCQQFRLKEPSDTEPVIIAQPGNKLVLCGKPPTGKKPKPSEAARTSNYNLNSLNTHTSQCQFTKTSRKRPTESLCFAQSSSTHFRVMEAANASTSATLGVNEVAFKIGQEMNQFKLEQNHKQMQKFNRVPMIGGGSKDKLAICRDPGNNSKKIGKRKLSWRDPLVLEV
ncbi:uncharacterized protein LOC121993835 [Zingiber officinale]|uniref:Uncharacterized protein n=1 Tax=Zingiber officinale TaxID=94328 RepID=A0A8J5KZW7_ZINOF|nr:uncharacterized protein LOC121993835 [Zingiber officinale]XP_042404063.1 uncharacterized protein LOC121993835 [Zingiber officinale]XP_042404064.1 uncharacterized protein LOC121993835 [Zingiber officinale]KAG6499287.1 hypothetical protein ZIOFF_039044 [Zingiber officinale]